MVSLATVVGLIVFTVLPPGMLLFEIFNNRDTKKGSTKYRWWGLVRRWFVIVSVVGAAVWMAEAIIDFGQLHYWAMVSIWWGVATFGPVLILGKDDKKWLAAKLQKIVKDKTKAKRK